MFKHLVNDFKTYFSINYLNRKRYPNSKISSYIPKGILIESKTTIKEDVIIENTNLSIGYGTFIGRRTLISNCSSIGAYCSISHDVKIGLDNHTFYGLSTSPLICSMIKDNPCEIHNDVLISANVVIMAGVKLGNGCIIGANSFVNKDIPPFAIAVGSPARIIKYRFDQDKINEIEQSEWWKSSLDTLTKTD
jgi:acetyltransferase-like isoleucine patch superfamily enzyme